jgi:hypothetical protein
MLCERESAKSFWKISFQPLKIIPLKDKKWVSSVRSPERHLWHQNNVGISNKLSLHVDDAEPRPVHVKNGAV